MSTIKLCLSFFPDIVKYMAIYLKLIVRYGTIWDHTLHNKDITTTDAALAQHYPLEWKRLQDIRNKYMAKP